MPYIHFGRIGDIWKHLPLAEYLATVRPNKYVESNSASSMYLLSNTPEQEYGIYHFWNNCHKADYLKQTAYYLMMKNFNPGNITTYPGSSAIALNLLKNIDCIFYFYDIEKDSINNIEKYTKQSGLKKRSHFYITDSINGIHKQLDEFNDQTFIHFDPYDAFTPNSKGISYLDLFFEAKNKGIMAMLWYGFMTTSDKKDIYSLIKKKLNYNNKERLSCVEVFLSSIQENSVLVNPGVVGSGVITCNLPSKLIEKTYCMANELKMIYKDSFVFDKYKGDIEVELIGY